MRILMFTPRSGPWVVPMEVAASAAAFEVAVLSVYTIELAAFEARARALNTWLNMRVRAIHWRHRQEGRRTKRQYAVQ